MARRALLREAALPVDDLVAPMAMQLFGAFDGDAFVGVVGLDARDDALLRSLTIASDRRDAAVRDAVSGTSTCMARRCDSGGEVEDRRALRQASCRSNPHPPGA